MKKQQPLTTNQNQLVRAKSWRPSTEYIPQKDLETDISLTMTDTESRFTTNRKGQAIKIIIFQNAAD